MNERGNEVRVGVTITVAGVVLVLGILWLGGVKFGDETYEFSVVFPEVAGLVVGDKVTVAGIASGEILALELANGKVLADLRLDEGIRVPVDSRISVSTYGLIGAKVIAIRPGESKEYVQPGDTVTGFYDQGLGDVVAEMGQALTEIRSVLSEAEEAISDVETRKRVGQTLENAAVASEELKLAVADFRATASELRGFVEENREGAGTTIDSLSVASARFAGLTAELRGISTSLDSIVTSVENGEGSLGKAIGDDEAHDEFVAAVREVRELVAEIRENPKSFVRFSIF
ncbi:MAG: MCE family protein [Candidatus Eisenbacteria bacterium]|nr:MCE family protein [Candidatus Eisenbacteria bacterium]